MLYPYSENGEGEITVADGIEVVIVEPDDGSGWMRVRHRSDEGLVPSAYVETLSGLSGPTHAPTQSSTSNLAVSLASDLADRQSNFSASSVSLAGSATGSASGGTGAKKKGPAVAPKRGAKKLQQVEALYDYTARSEIELSMVEGERFVLINRDSGDGWADVEKGGVKGSVPANYIADV